MMGKLAVISGGTKGIGRALINTFASRHFDIVTCSRNSSDLEKLKIEIEDNFGVEVYAFEVDLSKKKSVSGFITSVKDMNRTVDVLINNAGIFIPGSLMSEEEGVFEKIMQTNLFSAYYLTRGLIDEIRKAPTPHIFNICSTASIMAYNNGGSYSVSKFGLLGFSKCLREELKEEDIKVTSVIPGATFTASWEGSELPESRFMKAEDVANIISECQKLSPQSVIEEILLRPMQGDI